MDQNLGKNYRFDENFEANFNNLWGASLDGLSVFVVNSKFNNNVSDSSQFIDDTGLIVNSRGDFVLLENVEAKENRLIGATITAVGDVYVVRSTFTGNAGVTCSLSWCPAGSQIYHGYGLNVVTPGLVYLDGVNASDNNLFGATLEGSTVTVLNSTFNNNASGDGLIVNATGEVTLTNVTASANGASGSCSSRTEGDAMAEAGLVLEVKKADWKETRFDEAPVPELAPGQVLFRVDRFALTANNVSYALSGDLLGGQRVHQREPGPRPGHGEAGEHRHRVER